MSPLKPAAMLDPAIRHKPWCPNHLHWLIQEMAGGTRQPEQDHRTHLRATLEWVCRAQDACVTPDSGCVSAGWTFESGWLSASADTTGWLIETLLPAADYLGWPALAERACVMLEALLTYPDQGAPGQIHGLIAGHVQLGHAESLTRAVRGGYVMADMPMKSIAHHAQAAHALAAVGVIAGESNLLEAARRHLEIVLAKQTPCGWFPEPTGRLSTSALASITRSVIESSRLLSDERALLAGLRAAQGMHDHPRSDGWLAGAFDDGWMPAADQACMQGLAQLAVCWLRLAQLNQAAQKARWHDAAWRALAWIKRNQRTTGDNLALRDALPSAVPIWRGPSAFRFDALSAKHFADALMMDMAGITIPPIAETRLHP